MSTIVPMLIVIIQCCLLEKQCYAASFADVNKLYKNLTTRYNRYIRPADDQSHVTVIITSFYLVTLQEIDEVTGTVFIRGYFNISWVDFNLQWMPEKYGNATSITLPQHKIWKPPLVFANSVEKVELIRIKDSCISVTNTGIVTWMPGSSIVFSCSINSVYFPFDKQTCRLLVVVWGYSDKEIKITPAIDRVVTNYQIANNEWEITKTNVTTITIAEGVPEISFVFQFKRRPTFYVLNLLVPSMLMAMLNICVFLLPPDSGERVGFAVTLLLSVIVFLTIAQKLLPATTIPRLPYLCVALVCSMVMSGSIVVSVIIGCWLHYRKDIHPIPKWINKISACKLCVKRLNTIYSKGSHDGVKFNIDGDSSGDTKNGDTSDNHANSVTWGDIARVWDTLSLYFYIVIFVVSSLHNIFSIMQGLYVE